MRPAEERTQERIAELIAALEPLDDMRLAPAKELVQLVLALHGAGLAALLRIVRAQGGQALIEACSRDRDVSALLLLHDLHPQPLESRVREALARMRGELGVKGLGVRLQSVTDGVVTLSLDGSAPRGIPVQKLRSDIEAAVLELAPEIASIQLEGLPAGGEVAFVSLAALKSGTRKDAARDAS